MIDSKTPSTYDKFRRPDSVFHRYKYEEIFRKIPKERGARVLEIGCGTGVYTRFFVKDFDFVFSSDIDLEMVRGLLTRLTPIFPYLYRRHKL